MKNLYKLNKVFRNLGIDVRRFPTQLLRNRLKLLKTNNINLIFDVGGNVGQYATEMRNIGYDGKIVSFEPIKEAYDKLASKAEVDDNWDTVQIALGDSDGDVTINVSGNLASSSIRKINNLHVQTMPTTATVRSETIKINKLDSIIHNYLKKEDQLFVKIDTQGFEKNVIMGAKASTEFIAGFQMELSLVELYDGEMLFLEMIEFLREMGYEVHSLEPGFADPKTGQLYQVDALFFKSNLKVE